LSVHSHQAYVRCEAARASDQTKIVRDLEHKRLATSEADAARTLKNADRIFEVCHGGWNCSYYCSGAGYTVVPAEAMHSQDGGDAARSHHPRGILRRVGARQCAREEGVGCGPPREGQVVACGGGSAGDADNTLRWGGGYAMPGQEYQLPAIHGFASATAASYLVPRTQARSRGTAPLGSTACRSAPAATPRLLPPGLPVV
jgi:hypothetical protein